MSRQRISWAVCLVALAACGGKVVLDASTGTGTPGSGGSGGSGGTGGGSGCSFGACAPTALQGSCACKGTCADGTPIEVACDGSGTCFCDENDVIVGTCGGMGPAIAGCVAAQPCCLMTFAP